MGHGARPFAIVTEASSGLGYELAACSARAGFDLLIASDRADIQDVAATLRKEGTNVYAVRVNLAKPGGAASLLGAALGRSPDALLVNAWEAPSEEDLEEQLYESKRSEERSVAGALALVHGAGLEMRMRGNGRILLTGSLSGRQPAVHETTRAFFDAFAVALRHELRGSGVAITTMMNGVLEAGEHAPTEAEIARAGFEAMMRGQDDVSTGRHGKTRGHFGRRATEGLAEVHPISAAK